MSGRGEADENRIAHGTGTFGHARGASSISCRHEPQASGVANRLRDRCSLRERENDFAQRRVREGVLFDRNRRGGTLVRRAYRHTGGGEQHCTPKFNSLLLLVTPLRPAALPA